jgi:hypothetical protein
MSDDADQVASLTEREVERFAAFLREMRSRPLPLVTKCINCGQDLDECRRPYARCFYCASKHESRINWR